jgi:hypothetical protein
MLMDETKKKVELLAEGGEPVADVEIPRFQADPVVLIWGTRTFLRLTHNVYAEVLAYTVPMVSP